MKFIFLLQYLENLDHPPMNEVRVFAGVFEYNPSLGWKMISASRGEVCHEMISLIRSATASLNASYQGR